jgi:hypothetical protein
MDNKTTRQQRQQDNRDNKTADNKTTRQQDNKTTRQQDNKTTLSKYCPSPRERAAWFHPSNANLPSSLHLLTHRRALTNLRVVIHISICDGCVHMYRDGVYSPLAMIAGRPVTEVIAVVLFCCVFPFALVFCLVSVYSFVLCFVFFVFVFGFIASS